jgi:hypothetical protein
MKYPLIAIACLASMQAVPVHAQAPTHTTAPHAPNIVQKHPTLTGVAAGVATHAALKHSAAWKKAHHQKLSWAERHPTLSGIGAGTATRAVIQKTTHTHP